MNILWYLNLEMTCSLTYLYLVVDRFEQGKSLWYNYKELIMVVRVLVLKTAYKSSKNGRSSVSEILQPTYLGR